MGTEHAFTIRQNSTGQDRDSIDAMLLREERDRAIVAAEMRRSRLCDAYQSALAHRDAKSHTATTSRPEWPRRLEATTLSQAPLCVLRERSRRLVAVSISQNFRILRFHWRDLSRLDHTLNVSQCPHRSSFHRERRLRLFLDRLNIVEEVRSRPLLHMSPEPNLQRYVEGYGFSTVIRRRSFSRRRRCDKSVCRRSRLSKTFQHSDLQPYVEHVMRLRRPYGKYTGFLTWRTSDLSNSIRQPICNDIRDHFSPMSMIGSFSTGRRITSYCGSSHEQIFREAGFVGRLGGAFGDFAGYRPGAIRSE